MKKINKKAVGIAAIIVSLILIAWGVVPNLLYKETSSTPEAEEAEQVEKIENESIKEERIDKEVIPDDSSGIIGSEGDIDMEEAINKMGLEISILPEMEKEIPDMTKLESAIEKYLVENDLWDTTKVQSDFVISKDYDKKTLQMNFKLNNKGNNVLVVLIKIDTGNITLNHY